jgi:AcrR family transcriptional regulator
MAAQTEVKPNRRGTRSREAVLDSAEQLMAEQGYDAASVAALSEGAGIPVSSIYHYFGSKEGVLLAVMERGAARFFDALPLPDKRVGSQADHLGLVTQGAAQTLERNPDFLRILIVMAAQPINAGEGEVHRVVNRVREMALERLRGQMQVVFGLDPSGPEADHLARFSLAVFDGAFVAYQSRPEVTLGSLVQHLPAALIAVRRSLSSRG